MRRLAYSSPLPLFIEEIFPSVFPSFFGSIGSGRDIIGGQNRLRKTDRSFLS